MKSERATTTILRKIITAIFGLISMAIQGFFLYAVFFSGWNLQGLYALFQVIGFIIVVKLFNKNISSSYKMIWSIIILVFPLAGSLLYFICGNQRSFPSYKSKKIHEYLKDKILKNDCLELLKEEDEMGYKFARIINYSTNLPIYNNSDVTFFNDTSKKHLSMLEKINGAQKYIFMEYFILANGKLVDSLIEALKKKGSEGVEIKIIYDDVGSKMVAPKSLITRFEEINNLQITKYEPLGFNFNPAVNYRDHRKQTIIDGKYAFLGGDNLADEYIHEKERFGYWKDNSILIEGEAVNNCLLGFAESWYMSTKEKLETTKYMIKHQDKKTPNYVMPFYDGPTDKQNPVYSLYSALATNSKKYMYISTPYFIIDTEFINNICLACKSGVDVKIMLPGIPDKKTIYRVTMSHIGSILKAGGKVYLYKPGFNHAKNYIVDDKYAFIGSANIDYRSLYLHLENGALIINEEQTIKMRDDFLNDIAKCQEVNYDKWKNRKLFTKFYEFLLQLFSPLM